jgi:hypothetical protein
VEPSDVSRRQSVISRFTENQYVRKETESDAEFQMSGTHARTHTHLRLRMKKGSNGVNLDNTICGCGFRFDEFKPMGIKFGLKMVRNVLICDNAKYFWKKVLREQIGL